jgi:cytochrome P450
MQLRDIDLTDPDRFRSGFPHEVFSLLREQAPVWWHPPTPSTPNEEGFWVLSRYADIQAAARDTEAFSSERGGARVNGGTILPDLPWGVAAGVFMNMMDDPRHQGIRKAVAPFVSTRALASFEAQLASFVESIMDEIAGRTSCEFLTDVAARLPLQVVGLLLDVSPDDRGRLLEWGNTALRSDGSESAHVEHMQQANAALRDFGLNLIAERKTNPGTDMLSALTAADVVSDASGPTPVSDLELQMFFNLLIAAGTETTKGSLTGGLLALIDHPDQLQALRDDRSLLPSAIEEILRWTSVTPYNRRTATHDVELHGQHIHAGDKVTLWWASANRDETTFVDPFRFDVGRDPNPHLAFGHGTHFCLGANVARLEMRLVFDALLDRFDHFAVSGPVEWQASNSHTSVRRLPIAYRRRD